MGKTLFSPSKSTKTVLSLVSAAVGNPRSAQSFQPANFQLNEGSFCIRVWGPLSSSC